MAAIVDARVEAALESFRRQNESRRDYLVHHLTDRGFFAELDDVARSLIYACQNELQLTLDSTRFAYRVERGWDDYLEPFCKSADQIDPSRVRQRFEFEPQHADRTPIKVLQRFRVNQLTLGTLSLSGFGNIHAFVMKMIFRLGSKCGAEVSALIDSLSLPPEYSAVHIRRGDKIGDEDVHYPTHLYLDRLKHAGDASCLFAMSDEFQAVEDIKRFFARRGAKLSIKTLASESDAGFNVNQLRRGERFMAHGTADAAVLHDSEADSYKYRATTRLLAETVVALAASEVVSTSRSYLGKALQALHPDPSAVTLLTTSDIWTPPQHHPVRPHILDHYEKVLLIRIGHNGAGFFAYVQYVLNQILYCERNGFLPVVHFNADYNNFFYDKSVGEDMWDYYFEPVAGYTKAQIDAMVSDPNDRLTPDSVVALSDPEILQLCQFDPRSVYHYTYGYWREHPPESPNAWYRAMRMKGHRMVSEYVHLNASILREVNAFANENMQGHFVFGMHIRGTDMRYAPAVSLRNFCDEVDRRLERRPDARIFVATDQQQYIETLTSRYGDRLIFRPCLRSVDANNPMRLEGRRPAEQGMEVLIDALLLARCDFMLKSPSAVSEFAHYFNPMLHSLDLNRHQTAVGGQDYAVAGLEYGDYPRAWNLVRDQSKPGQPKPERPEPERSGRAQSVDASDYHWSLVQRFLDSRGVGPEPRGEPTSQAGVATASPPPPYSLSVDPRVREPWIVTSADKKFWHYVICFVASLRDIAGFEGKLAVIDYGLTPRQRRALEMHAVELIKPRMDYWLVIDRYFATAEFFSNRADATILYFDADIWFAEPIGELFEREDILAGNLAAAKDVWECDYYYTCTWDRYQPAVRELLKEVISSHGQTLQAGFIAGTSGAWQRYVDLLKTLLTRRFARNRWGADALALNFYAKLFETEFSLLPITYNAPPAWDIVRRDGRFYATNFRHDGLHDASQGPIPVKAIHCTSPSRGRQRHLEFEHVHPDAFAAWRERLGAPDTAA